ncbi:hypothetical protein N7462_010195 [Penicillium macrosclerotiorum]|uniref:uncharacterized protein n=1 Tax=Penicillium macrosclerotiorum TaxID=303699 RepID=UPI0025496920|nr:uncharacterized protein N7462_010195 [Penicillium macrosclerotiorum]KAJ5669125.1 hypothetical protein N7462_010195 [Penicillium macrosclerotiorum]
MQKNAIPPGQQAPWALMNAPGVTSLKLAASTSMDPFDALPLKMPFKSQELYHYFYQTGAAFAVAPSDPKDDCFALATLDEHALRSTILIAGVHYLWNTGNSQAYESAFLFHKIESIRIINTWLKVSDSKTFVVCVRQILTICLAEACLGNLPAAETHLNGIMALFNSRTQEDSAFNSTDDRNTELANRYLLLASCFVLILKSRLEDFMVFRASQGINSYQNDSSAEALQLMKMWHVREYGGLNTRLKAMRLFPYFFSPPPLNRRPKPIDALPIFECLKSITKTIDQFRINPTAEGLDQVWNEGGPTKLLLVVVDAHVSSLTRNDEILGFSSEENLPQSHLQTSWSGILATAALYMHSVLNIANAGEAIECRLLYRILLIMKQDIDQTRDDLSGDRGGLYQTLWFWKVFIGALALGRSQGTHIAIDMKTAKPSVKCSCETNLEELHDWFRNNVRAWSVVTGKKTWKDAEPVLATLAWPAVLSQSERDYAASSWAEGISE